MQVILPEFVDYPQLLHALQIRGDDSRTFHHATPRLYRVNRSLDNAF